MSILSSNNVNFKITLKYLRQRGYVWHDLHENGWFYIFRGRMYSDHMMMGWNCDGELVSLFLCLSGYPIMHIKSIADLNLLENMWGEKNKKRKIDLKHKLIKQCSNEYIKF